MSSGMGFEYDVDLPLLVAALCADGHEARAVAWDDPEVVWDAFDLALIRSTWDYAARIEEYLAWVDTAARATRLCNPAQVVRWGCDKRYLPELAARGVPVVPTLVVEPGGHREVTHFDLSGPVVVKPVVSAGAQDTARYDTDHRADAVRHARALLDQGRAVLVQPYLPLVSEGERALVFFSGAFSHAIRKQPVLTEPNVVDNSRDPHPGVTPHQPSPAELRTALAALAAVPGEGAPLYARVDLALGADREPVVMEVELVEPHLFLDGSPGALERFTSAVATALATAGTPPR
ncbi:RimK family alpha-L-glutamate ligase [Streptomyces sp. cg36]|uniref:ATP-grasp domain-containing protein n=1 Tax=Streptomyces sp. cg36 TaxID=3238798 RepID=UPI0034E21D8F